MICSQGSDLIFRSVHVVRLDTWIDKYWYLISRNFARFYFRELAKKLLYKYHYKYVKNDKK